jgi:hypothetical protein
MRRALPLITLLVLLAGCGTSAPASPQVPAEGDAVLVQKVLDGQLDADSALAQVARSSGWPITTSRGYLFATRDQGQGPYWVESPSGAFARVQLTSSSGLAWAVLPVASPVGAEYRFVAGTGANFSDGLSRYFAYSGDATLSFVSLDGKHLERWHFIADTNIASRTLRVLVPAQAPTHTMFVHDGQNLFGPSPFGGWGLQDAGGPTTLVVGIDNTSDRIAEYTPVQDVVNIQTLGGKGLDYADFVEHTVRPFINQTEIEAWAALGACPAGAFYVDSGGGPGTGCVDSDGDGIQDDNAGAADNYCENLQMRDTLLGLGCDGHVTYVFVSGAPHSEPAWRGRSPAIFQLFESG